MYSTLTSLSTDWCVWTQRIAPPKIPNIYCQPQSISTARRQLSKFDLTTLLSTVKSRPSIPKMPPSSATYTTIPISGVDVIFRSTQNLSASLSRCRPWPEFLSPISAFDLPPSASAASLRFRRNAAYFSVNYAVIITACAAVSLLGSPISLILVGFVYFLWLILHFFREDPLLVWGHHVSDWAVILGLVLISVVAFWITGPLNSLSIGVGLGLLISVVHGVLRNPEGLFLDENDAVSNGLIVSTSKPTASGTPSCGIPFSPPV
ncbi:PRA1 family protein G2 [Striga hermonthica]|uniref:PRA1 family protein n=1 Tax=Striga hermonthica TaxID=68872 RepID=A0A9N7NM17_STRHE|nr:PRA1 family protein G2 [Striga hermonthica]